MKLTFKLGKYDRGGKHNDRNFDFTDDDHIDNDRVKDNLYANYIGREGETFTDSEKRFYDEHFGEALERWNRNKKKNGHKKDMKSMKQFMNSSHSRIEDGWFQVGTKDDHIDGETLWKIFEEWKEKHDEMYGSKCIFLNASLHMDEATPHIQFRRVWLTENSRGDPTISKSACLRELGFTVPETDLNGEPVKGRGDTAINSMFTMSERMALREITREHGIELEPMSNEPFIPHNQYKEKKAGEHLAVLTKDIEDSERTLSDTHSQLEGAKQELSETKQELSEAEAARNDVMDDLESILESILQNEAFLRDRNLTAEEVKGMKLKEKHRLITEYNRILKDSTLYGVPMENVESLPFRDEYYKAEDYIAMKGLSDDFEKYKVREAQREAGIDVDQPDEQAGDPDELPDWIKN